MLGRWVSSEQRRRLGPSAAQPTPVESPPRELLSDDGINPCMATVTTPLDTSGSCQHPGTCQHTDTGSKAIELATATMLFLSVRSSRFQSGPSNALHLRGKETSQTEDRASMRAEAMEKDSSATSSTLLACARGLVRFVNRQFVIESTASAKPVPV